MEGSSGPQHLAAKTILLDPTDLQSWEVYAIQLIYSYVRMPLSFYADDNLFLS